MHDRGEDRKRKRWKEEEAQRRTEVAFQAYMRLLVAVLEFKYLGRVLTEYDYDCSTVVGNFRNVRKRWARISRIIGWEGADPRNSGSLNKWVVQATLLFGAESWVIPPWIRRTLGGFHHRVDRWMKKRRIEGTGKAGRSIFRWMSK